VGKRTPRKPKVLTEEFQVRAWRLLLDMYWQKNICVVYGNTPCPPNKKTRLRKQGAPHVYFYDTIIPRFF